MWRAVAALACAVVLAAQPAHALAAPANGMLAAISEQRVVTLNPDGSGLRTLWAPAAGGGEIAGLAWAPDGNRIALSYGGRIVVLDVPGARVVAVSTGLRDTDPAWSADGSRLGFRRVVSDTIQWAFTAAPDGSDPRREPLPAATAAVARAPSLTQWALVVPPAPLVSGLDLPL